MDFEANLKVIHRYLSGECTPREREKLEKWMEADPKNQEAVRFLRDIWEVKPLVDLHAELDWERFEKRMEQRSGKGASEADRRPVGSMSSYYGSSWFRVAALLLVSGLLALAGVLFTWNIEGESVDRKVVTQPGERSQIVLDDGSEIQMNVDSRLVIPADYGEKVRSIELTGEAYFDIEPQERPFLVYTEKFVIRITGTEFNVRSYKEDGEKSVVVTEGSVSVEAGDGGHGEVAHLGQGDIARWSQATSEEGVLSIDHAQGGPYIGWLQNHLEFDATPLNEVVRELERWYNTDIRLSDPDLGSLRMTADFENESLYEVLEVLRVTLDLEYETDDREITISPKL